MGGTMKYKCPNCGTVVRDDVDRCPRCKLPLIETDRMNDSGLLPMRQLIMRAVLVLIGLLMTVSIIVFAGVRIHYWFKDREIRKNYVNHTVETLTLDNGVSAHAVSFFGNDGDSVYIEELQRSYQYVGGVARVEFPDYIWFNDDPIDIESAEVTFSPVHISINGEKTKLPAFTINVPVPESPIIIKSPTTDYVNVITSISTINMNVVYGSRVIINGEDVSDKVDRSGALSLNVNVYPVGENPISIIVRSEHHKEARRDIVFFRDVMEINLELATNVSFSSPLNYMTITGKTDPNAWITVDTEYDTKSLIIDQETGKFSFKAKFKTYGDNLVSFHASMDGKKDSNISFYVKYVPAKAEYSRNAWAMDYKQLRTLYEQWHGRVFLCKGKIVDTFFVNETQYSVMDVGKDEQQFVILENQSDVGSLQMGAKFEVYADVSGRQLYKANYYPCLIARYASQVAN